MHVHRAYSHFQSTDQGKNMGTLVIHFSNIIFKTAEDEDNFTGTQ